MIVSHLSLTNFRNYPRLELDLPPHIVVILGNNAQGKTNFLEGIYLLATSKSPRSSRDGELINWAASTDDLAACRIVADIERAGKKTRVEIALKSRPGPEVGVEPRGNPARAAPALKRIRVNSIVRRAVDLIGQVNVVMFSAEDIDLVRGEPALRRRYLDIANSQVDRVYLRQLQHYNRVLEQRNHLLRMIEEKRATPDELAFWDDGLVKSGSYIMAQREFTVATLNKLVQQLHPDLSGGQERLHLVYLRNIDKGVAGEGQTLEEIAASFTGALHLSREKEIAQGMSLTGPHRDDLRFMVNGADIGVYGSRGQQRTVALSLRLAESTFMSERVKDTPVLLLDDVLSELDADRRRYLLQCASRYNQVVITSTGIDVFDAGFLANATLFRVTQGNIERIPGNVTP